MEDFNIIIKQSDGTEIVANIDIRLEKIKSRELKRKSIHSIEQIRELTKDVLFEEDKRNEKVDLDGDIIKGNSQRYQTFFTKGIKCVCCGIEGKYFAKEKTIRDKSYHLNLYAINKNGKEVLMIKDHIIPKSKGGRNHIDNYQTMCINCNITKGNATQDNIQISNPIIGIENNMQILFVRYVNYQCESKIFNNMAEAIKFVYENFGQSKTRGLSKNYQKHIYARIQNSIQTKQKYCCGEWILINN